MEDIRQRVKAGARWLDEHQPGWEHQIVVKDLDMRDACNCVLGQLVTTTRGRANNPVGGWTRVVAHKRTDRYFEPDHPLAMTLTEAGERGFDAVAPDLRATEWETLAEEWRRVIKRRRKAKVVR